LQQNKVDIRKHTQTAYGVGAVVFFKSWGYLAFMHVDRSPITADGARRLAEWEHARENIRNGMVTMA
jgi:hypothetical protein